MDWSTSNGQYRHIPGALIALILIVVLTNLTIQLDRREMMKKYVVLGVILLALMSMPLTSSADLISVADPFETASWGQRFNESGVGSFNKIEIVKNDDPIFESPAIRNFSVSGWHLLLDEDYYALASGPSTTTSVDFDIIFIGEKTPVSFYFVAWYDSNLLEAALAKYNGGWTFSAVSLAEVNSHRVPEPTTMFLFGSGLVGFVVLRKKFER
jgi:hypothetical protein